MKDENISRYLQFNAETNNDLSKGWKLSILITFGDCICNIESSSSYKRKRTRIWLSKVKIKENKLPVQRFQNIANHKILFWTSETQSLYCRSEFVSRFWLWRPVIRFGVPITWNIKQQLQITMSTIFDI